MARRGQGLVFGLSKSSSLGTWRQRLDYGWSSEKPGAPGDSDMVRSPRTPARIGGYSCEEFAARMGHLV